MGNVRDLLDQSMFALSTWADAESIDRRIEIYHFQSEHCSLFKRTDG